MQNINHKSLEKALEHAQKLCESLPKGATLKPIASAIETWKQGLYKLTFVGEVKKGKSSGINSLLQHPGLSPVAEQVATNVAFKIIYGPKLQYRVHFLPIDPLRPESRPPAKVISADEVAAYGTENGTQDNPVGNPSNAKRVDFISIELDHELLRSGLVIVDLPGLGGLLRQHAETTWRNLPGSDHLCFVVDSTEQVLSRDEVALLNKLRDITPRFFFIQTKSDLGTESQCEMWRKRNLEIIKDSTGLEGEQVPYFVLSNRLKREADETGDQDDLKDSGFLPLLDYVDSTLLKQKKNILAAPVINYLDAMCGDCGASLKEQRRLYAATSLDEQKAIQADIEKRQQEFFHWSSQTLPPIRTAYQRELQDAVSTGRREIQRVLSPSVIVNPMMDEVSSNARTEEDVINALDQVVNACINECGERMYKIYGQYNAKAEAAYDKAMDDIGESIPFIYSQDTSLVKVPDVEKVSLRRMAKRGSTLETARSGFMSYTFGSAAGGALCIPLAILVPVIPIAVGAIMMIGGLFGAKKAIEDSRKRNLESALLQLTSVLIDAIQQTMNQCLGEFDKTTTDRNREVIDQLDRTISDKNEQLRDMVKECEESLRLNQSKAQDKLKAIDGHLRDVAQLATQLKVVITTG